MMVNTRIMEAVGKAGYKAYPDVYEGTDPVYFTFNYVDERGIHYEDDEELLTRISVQIHLFCPKDFDYTSLKRSVRRQLLASGFEVGSIQNFYENETRRRHIVFECEIDVEGEE